LFADSLPVVLKFEGGYSNHKDDPGGATMKGVTQETYDTFRKRKAQPTQSVRNILFSEVEEIYRQFWISGKCDEFSDSHPLTALVHFDFTINAGFKQSAKTLQRTLSVKPIDGIIGSVTLGVLLKQKDSQLAVRYLDFRENFYKDLTIKKPALKVFLKGWLNRTSHLRRIVNERASNNNTTGPISSTA
jgi:lysozyme family protein